MTGTIVGNDGGGNDGGVYVAVAKGVGVFTGIEVGVFVSGGNVLAGVGDGTKIGPVVGVGVADGTRIGGFVAVGAGVRV